MGPVQFTCVSVDFMPARLSAAVGRRSDGGAQVGFGWKKKGRRRFLLVVFWVDFNFSDSNKVLSASTFT